MHSGVTESWREVANGERGLIVCHQEAELLVDEEMLLELGAITRANRSECELAAIGASPRARNLVSLGIFYRVVDSKDDMGAPCSLINFDFRNNKGGKAGPRVGFRGVAICTAPNLIGTISEDSNAFIQWNSLQLHQNHINKSGIEEGRKYAYVVVRQRHLVESIHDSPGIRTLVKSVVFKRVRSPLWPLRSTGRQAVGLSNRKPPPAAARREKNLFYFVGEFFIYIREYSKAEKRPFPCVELCWLSSPNCSSSSSEIAPLSLFSRPATLRWQQRK